MKNYAVIFLFCLPLFSSAQLFEIRTLHVVTNDLVYDRYTNKIYGAIPASNGGNGNSIGVFPVSGFTLQQTVNVGSDPSVLAIAGDGSCLYTGFEGSSTVRRVLLPTLTPQTPFSLGSGGFVTRITTSGCRWRG